MRSSITTITCLLLSLHNNQAFQPLLPVTRAGILPHSRLRQPQQAQRQVLPAVALRAAANGEDDESFSSPAVRTGAKAPIRPPPPKTMPTPMTTMTTASQQFASAVAKRSDLDKGAAAQMDETIFKFNKTLIDTIYDLICFIYPVKGNDRDFARFFVLETVARVPYFAYLSVLHLRETFGERGLGDRMRTHYSEADNELHHLLIMEELGGNSNPIDRLVAQTMAFGYYWYVVLVYFLSEEAAYHLSELIEDHAFETYDGFLKNHGDRLKKMPVPKIAIKYYQEDNPFLFDLFCTVKDKDNTRNFSEQRPQLGSLYDVFVNIRDDEREHWKTLCNLVQYGDMQGIENKLVRSTEAKIVAAS